MLFRSGRVLQCPPDYPACRQCGRQWRGLGPGLRSITLTPAEIYGVGDRYGALANGYAGDVVVWDGDPLEVMSSPTAVLIDGEMTEMDSRQTRLLNRYINITDETPFAYRR